MKTTRLYVLLFLMALLTGCTGTISTDPALGVEFSVDTLRFDTVFTGMGSATKRVKIYNPNKQALRISRAAMESGQYFQINIDGESSPSKLKDIVLNGGDSLHVFVKVNIDPTNVLSPLLVTDRLLLEVNGHTTQLVMEAFGQNVHVLRRHTIDRSTILMADKPYLVYDYLLVDSTATLTMNAGTRFYFYEGAQLIIRGNWKVRGTQERPVVLRSHRMDNIYDSVPYNLVAGQWDGVFLLPGKGMAPTYEIEHLDLMSSIEGLYAYNTQWQQGDPLPKMRMSNSRIHNLAEHGLVLINTDAEVANSEISNAAQYCVYLAGGTHTFVHTTIASYFGYTTVNYQNASRGDVAALYIDNVSKTMAPTRTFVYNSVITGVRKSNLLLATPFPDSYGGEISHCYIKNDTIRHPFCHDNRYAQPTDTTFVNDCFEYVGHRYYDFRPDSASAFIGLADTVHALLYPTDRHGQVRALPATAGCYEAIVKK